MNHEIHRSIKEVGGKTLERKLTSDITNPMRGMRGKVEKILVEKFVEKPNSERSVYKDPGTATKSDHVFSIWPVSEKRKNRVEETIEKFAGQLSTDSDKVGPKVNQKTLTQHGPYIVEGLFGYLQEANLGGRIVDNNPSHPFIIIDIDENDNKKELIVDPLIGKFLTGKVGDKTLPPYKAVFVGSPEEHKRLVATYGKGGAISYLWEDKGRTMTTKVNPTSSDRFYDLVWDRSVKS